MQRAMKTAQQGKSLQSVFADHYGAIASVQFLDYDTRGLALIPVDVNVVSDKFILNFDAYELVAEGFELDFGQAQTLVIKRTRETQSPWVMCRVWIKEGKLVAGLAVNGPHPVDVCNKFGADVLILNSEPLPKSMLKLV